MSVNPVVEYERSRCAILTLILKRKWFDMIASGEKREEYRAATRYWRVRLHNWCRRAPTSLPVVEFRLGYSATAQRMAYWCLGIETASGLMPYAYVDSLPSH